MVNLTINNIPISVAEGTTIMEAAEQADILIPHLCYMKEINEIGACRLCSVEIEGEKKLIPSCITKVEEGMVVTTNSSRVRGACRTNLELIMSQHNGKCSMCTRNGNCHLQALARDFNLLENPYEEDIPSGKLLEWNAKFPLIRDTTKCIKCMRCIQVCDKVQNVGVWDLIGTGGRTRVGVAGNRKIEETNCALCGQCIVQCPVGALRARDDVDKVLSALDNPDMTTIVQIAPAVRSAWGENLGLPEEKCSVNHMASALKSLGFNYVFDTCFSADLTIMEEGTEFVHRLTTGDLDEYPMFTSCCPGWVRFIKSHYPQLIGQLSTAKSPQQMFGATAKSYFADKIGVSPDKICVVSIMPCSAKKSECDIPTMKNTDGIKDVDYVLTTREMCRLFSVENVDVANIQPVPFDRLMGDYTGAGVIFGVTGGVMEAALRSAAYLVTGHNTEVDAFMDIRAEDGDNRPWRDAVYDLNGTKVRVAVTSGLRNASRLCEAIIAGEAKYDFVEIMACPNGCSGGGGQPMHQDDIDRRRERGKKLYVLDEDNPIRFSHENPEIQLLYDDFFGKPLSEKSESYLHTDHFGWEMPQ